MSKHLIDLELSRFSLMSVVLMSVVLMGGASCGLALDEESFFRQKIAPILQVKCIRCHNDNEREGGLSLQSKIGFDKGGENGRVFHPGRPVDSSLLESILGDDPEMPKDDDPLTPQELGAIKKWIVQGGHWPADLRLENQSIDQNWWSLKPVHQPRVPLEHVNPIDYFVEKKQVEQNLSLNREATRRALIRRLYFDLIGLPPTESEIAEFLASSNPLAYSQLVEKLLESNRYGEKWARHWLDVVQYGETHGYDKDKPRMNAWPYRDYVIRALNSDKPYSRFVREQLAGDVLWPQTPDGIVATGFISAGPWDLIGHAEVPESKIDGQVARNLDRDNMVTSTMNTFCSVTVQCARCHHHKLDPVTMEEYYSLQAVFAAIDRADRGYDIDPQVAKKRAALRVHQTQLGNRLQELKDQIDAKKTPEIIALEKKIKTLSDQLSKKLFPKSPLPKSARMGYHSHVANTQETLKWVQVDLGQSTRIEQVILTGAVEYGFEDFGFPQRYVVECSDTSDFKNRQLIADYRASDFPRPGAVPVVIEVPPNKDLKGRFVRITATKLWNRRNKGSAKTNDWIFALGELSIVSKGRSVNVQSVSSLDSIEASPGWSRQNLIDHVYGEQDLETKLGRKESKTNGYHSLFSDQPGSTKWIQLELKTASQIDEIRLLPAYPTDFKETPGFGFPLRFRIEVANDPNFKDAVQVANQEKSDYPNPLTKPVCFALSSEKRFRFVRVTATRLWDRGDPSGQNHAFALSELMVISGDNNVAVDSTVTASDSINHGRWHQDFLIDGYTSRLKVNHGLLYLTKVGQEGDLRPELNKAILQKEQMIKSVVGKSVLDELASHQKLISEVRTESAKLPKSSQVYAGTVHNGQGAFRGRAGLGPREIFVLQRGNVTQRRQEVQPGTLPFIQNVAPLFNLPDGHDEGARRVALANWITHPDNPLTWRSIVNRVWQYHFGRGIVETPNDFGRGGSKPTHPQLLDWLAIEFRDGGKYLERQSIKSLHRLICNSRVYRQSSQSAKYSKVDGENRFLWRMNRRRLSAEEIHDAVLQVSGLLNFKMGGPSYQDFVIQRPEHSPHYEYHLYDPFDLTTHRRAVYRFIVRSQPQPFMDTLDCADPSFSVPKRSETLTALQALGMLNNRFMVAMSQQFAERLEKKDVGLRAQIQRGFRAVTGRNPDQEEIVTMEKYAQQHGLKNLCRVFFNMNEFVFVD
ncbi:MAG: DUF1553 domain-containing protein [Planctomycetota bacterium]|nr:DUF1553 domain-containing protein [Planctomycetota bacterium]